MIPCPLCGQLLRSKKSMGGHYSQAHTDTPPQRSPVMPSQPFPGDWTERRACKGQTDLMFGDAESRGATSSRRTQAAKKVCATCPVIDHCLNYALTFGEKFGVWGGLSPKERSRLRIERRRAS